MTKATEPDAEPVRRSFNVPCIKCGESGTLRLDVEDVAGFHCSQCDNDFTAADVEGLIAKWQPLLAWVRTCPSTSRSSRSPGQGRPPSLGPLPPSPRRTGT